MPQTPHGSRSADDDIADGTYHRHSVSLEQFVFKEEVWRTIVACASSGDGFFGKLVRPMTYMHLQDRAIIKHLMFSYVCAQSAFIVCV